MASGLLIDLNDGNPAMQITAGMRCPSFCNLVNNAWDQKVVNIDGYVPGSQVIVIPRDPVSIQNRGTNLVPTIGMQSGYSQNGSQLTFYTWWSDNWRRDRLYDLTICQIFPTSGGRGLLISDSTDFTTIPDATRAGFCVWAGTVTFTGQWRTPDTGYDRNKYMVFGRWSADGVTVEYDGNNIYARNETNGQENDATVTMRVAIFASGVAPQPGTGLNFFNAAGQCTFSTVRRPFIFRNRFYNPSWDYQDIGGGMILLGRYGFRSRVSGGRCRAKFAGLMMSGNSVRCASGITKSNWTSRYSVVQERLVGMSVPIIENMY
ncbi:membrane protein [Klebsiella phage vB_KpS_KW1.1]